MITLTINMIVLPENVKAPPPAEKAIGWEEFTVKNAKMVSASTEVKRGLHLLFPSIQLLLLLFILSGFLLTSS